MEDIKIVSVNFGTVFCGEKTSKTIKLDNKTKKVKTYVIQPVKSYKWNTSYERLNIEPREVILSPGKSANFTLTYLSHLENVTDNMFFEIFDPEKFVMRLNVKARSAGPLLSPSVVDVAFYSFRDINETIKHVELVNAAKCNAKFLFDSDQDNEIIQISRVNGLIPPSSKINIKLTFRPKERGVYYKQIFCLVQFHKPIILNVLGINNPKLRMNPKTFIYKYPFPSTDRDAYQSYFETLNGGNVVEDKMPFFKRCVREYQTRLDDTSVVENSKVCDDEVPAQIYTKDEIVLTKRFVDMKNQPDVCQACALINLSETRQYFYIWDHDSKNNFEIEPCRGFLEPGKRIDFGIRFVTPAPDQLFSACLDVRVFPSDEEPDQSVQLPLTMSLRIIGNSFPNDNCGWVPQCTVIPKNLQMPSCAPGKVVYANITIERRGHLPVIFHCVLPENSKYRVQPQMGWITENFQILVVEFDGDKSGKGTFKENLRIIYNDSPMNFDQVRLTSFVEIPELRFGNENSFTFECTFPQSKTVAEIPVENVTNLNLRYEFVTPEDIQWLEIVNPKGLVEPMASFTLKTIFKPDVPQEYLDYIQCNVSSSNEQPNHQPEIMQFQVKGSCQFGYLVATPNVYDFGECVCGVEQTIQINVFNFSPVNLIYRLRVAHRAFPVGNVEDVTINPSRGVLPGKSNEKIDISIVPHDQDIFQYALLCEILETDSENASPREEPRKIFLFRFEGVLPSFQIIDLYVENGGPLFSPHWIWKMMSINRLNKALNSLMPEQKIYMKFPEAMAGSPPVTLTLLVEAEKFGEVSWNMERRVFCPCPEYSVDQTNCMHSNAVKWTPTKGTLSPRSRLQMCIVVGYEHPDEFIVQWTINLPYNRKIILEAEIVSLPEDEPSFTSMYLPPFFHLRSIFLGDMDPPVQLFWLYNNTHRSTSYVVDKSTLRESTTNPPRIFDCVNSNGVIPPFSCVPLIFLFKPNELVSYSTEFLVCTRQDMPTKITLKGEGVPLIEQIKELCIEATIPEKSILTNPNISIQANVNFINIPYLHVFSDAKRLFFLRNTSLTDSWAFRWHNFRAGKLIEAKIIPTQGLIKPGEKTNFTLVVKSMCKPTCISISVPCDVINYTALKKYESAIKIKKELDEKSQHYFTIPENIHEEPSIPIPEEPVPKHVFITVNVNIISHINTDQKLSLKQQLSLKSGRERIHEVSTTPEIAQYMLPCIQNIMERVLWKILNSKIFKHRVVSDPESFEYGYDQIQPKTDRKTIENYQRMSAAINRNYIQDYLETLIKNILIKNFAESKAESVQMMLENHE